MSSQRIEHKCAQQLGSPWPRRGNHHQAHKRVMGRTTWARHAARCYSAINKREVLPPARRGPISETSCGVEGTGLGETTEHSVLFPGRFLKRPPCRDGTEMVLASGWGSGRAGTADGRRMFGGFVAITAPFCKSTEILLLHF